MLYNYGISPISRDIRVGAENLGNTVIALMDQVHSDRAVCGAGGFSKEELSGFRSSHMLPPPHFMNRVTVLRDLQIAMKYIAEFNFDAAAIKPLVDAAMLMKQCLDGTLTLQWKPRQNPSNVADADITEIVELALKGLSWPDVRKGLPPSSTRTTAGACSSAFHRFARRDNNSEKDLLQCRAVSISVILHVLITPSEVPACVLSSLLPECYLSRPSKPPPRILLITGRGSEIEIGGPHSNRQACPEGVAVGGRAQGPPPHLHPHLRGCMRVCLQKIRAPRRQPSEGPPPATRCKYFCNPSRIDNTQ
jgi:hypothetical protein